MSVRVRGAGGIGMVVFGITVAASGCKVDQAAFDTRVFACNPSARDPGCGKDPQGTPMTCYPGSLLDGTDFCAPGCGDTPISLPNGNVCVEGGAELAFCDPSAAAAACGSSQLACLRTDVTSQEGVCTTMTPCSLDADCTDPVRSTCAATFLSDLYAKNQTMHADHLYCLQKNCQSGNSACSPGQSCLPLLVPASAHAPDICVPNCDAHGNCPPNHVCFQKISGPANPAICIPGLLGFICQTDIDCLVGTCQSDQDPSPEQGLKLCTIGCDRDDECSVFDSDQGTFFCAIGVGAGGKSGHCEMPNAYRGNSCHKDSDCTRDAAGARSLHEAVPDQPGLRGRPLDRRPVVLRRRGLPAASRRRGALLRGRSMRVEAMPGGSDDFGRRECVRRGGGRVRRLALAGLLLLATATAARPARAAEKIAVLVLGSSEKESELADNLTEVLIAYVAQHGGFEIAGKEEFRARLGVENERRAQECL
ncbi:MAG: hypothetical protein ABUS79_32180, partial [Pseudomonadota bacterium]